MVQQGLVLLGRQRQMGLHLHGRQAHGSQPEAAVCDPVPSLHAWALPLRTPEQHWGWGWGWGCKGALGRQRYPPGAAAAWLPLAATSQIQAGEQANKHTQVGRQQTVQHTSQQASKSTTVRVLL